MPQRGEDAVRVISRGPAGIPAPPGRGIAALLITAFVAGLITLLVGLDTNEPAAAITVPEPLSGTLPSSTTLLDRTPVVTATRPPTATYLASSATMSGGVGLADLAPQWEGTLHLTVGLLDDGWEISEWIAAGSGPRLLTLTDQPRNLEAASVEAQPGPYRVFNDVLGYAWHQTDPGRIAWLSGGTDGTVELHQGTSMEEAVHFRPVHDLAWLAIPADGTLSLTAFGDWGFLAERWTIDGDLRRIEVFALDLNGGFLRKEGECRFWFQFADCSGFWPIG
jgi:hypothetical protein